MIKTMTQPMFEEILEFDEEPEYERILKFVELFNEVEQNHTGVIEFEWYDDEMRRKRGGHQPRSWYRYQVVVSLKDGLLHNYHQYASAFHFQYNGVEHEAHFENGKFAQDVQYNYCIHYEDGWHQVYKKYYFDLDFKIQYNNEESLYRGYKH
jgi:hypothetical protein